jgi:excisionase family DNA binding protein
MEAVEKKEPAFVTAQEVADVLGVSKWQVYELAKTDSLPLRTIRIGNRMLRFSRVELERLINGETTVEEVER